MALLTAKSRRWLALSNSLALQLDQLHRSSRSCSPNFSPLLGTRRCSRGASRRLQQRRYLSVQGRHDDSPATNSSTRLSLALRASTGGEPALREFGLKPQQARRKKKVVEMGRR